MVTEEEKKIPTASKKPGRRLCEWGETTRELEVNHINQPRLVYDNVKSIYTLLNQNHLKFGGFISFQQRG